MLGRLGRVHVGAVEVEVVHEGLPLVEGGGARETLELLRGRVLGRGRGRGGVLQQRVRGGVVGRHEVGREEGVGQQGGGVVLLGGGVAGRQLAAQQLEQRGAVSSQLLLRLGLGLGRGRGRLLGNLACNEETAL